MESYEYKKSFEAAVQASKLLLELPTERVNEILNTLADVVDANHRHMIEANMLDLERMDKTNPLYDRLMLNNERLSSIASDMRKVGSLPSPIGETIEDRMLENGIQLRKTRVPYGVIGIIYEARPNVTFDVFSLCFKSGNACILKGGSDAEFSNRAAVSLIHEVLEAYGLPTSVCTLLPSNHESASRLLNARGYVDLCIPRGGRRLIDFVRENAQVPVIETGAGVVHAYFDKEGNIETGKKVVENSKTRRVSVCNALDTLLISRERLSDLPSLVSILASKNVELHADDEAYSVLAPVYPANLLAKAMPGDWDTEWMDYKMGIRTVNGLEEALSHIADHGSGHSETIVTDNPTTASRFQTLADASSVYVNLPTSFTDGGQFGLGAEIGISTQKLGPRGPMGLREITTYKYLLSGNGQTRP